jgi:hypothetical protein
LNVPLVLNWVGLVAVSGWLIAQVYPPTRAVRLRNAILARSGTSCDFDWTPDNAPAMFWRESGAAYAPFRDAVAALDLAGRATDWDKAVRIAEHLMSHAQDLGSIQSDLVTTYARIRMGYGYCADFVKVFLGLSHAAGLYCRQWCFSFDGFGGHGHTIVEVFDRTAGKWFLLDVHNNIHVRDAVTGIPLGVIEFREALQRGTPAFRIAPNGAGRLGFPLEEKLLAYYKRGLQEWYLVLGNAVFSYEAYPLVGWASRCSGPLGQIVATCLGKHPLIQVLATSENAARVKTVMALRCRFQVAMLAFVALLLLLVFQISAYGVSLR